MPRLALIHWSRDVRRPSDPFNRRSSVLRNFGLGGRGGLATASPGV